MIIFLVFFITDSVSAETLEEIKLSNGEVVEVIYSNNSEGYRYEIVFENGHKYTFEQSGNLGTGGGSPDLTNHERELAEEAIDQFEKSHGSAGPSKSRIKSVSVSIILILLGLFGLIFPQAAWYLQIG